MTPDERQILSHFLNDLVNARSGPKDPEAAQMIDQALRANADGAYLLVQHAVISDQALHDAQAQIADLQQQLQAAQAQGQQAPGGGSFFGGAGARGPWGARQAQPGYSQPGYNPGGYVPQTYAQPAQAQPQPMGGGMFGGGGGLGSFLRQAGTMAAGVAAGDMLFSGLSGMFGGGRGGFGGGYGGGGVENVTINNYGDDSDDDGGSGDYSDDGGDDS
jgi:hypothetical protein